jgi:hypothetical protein
MSAYITGQLVRVRQPRDSTHVAQHDLPLRSDQHANARHPEEVANECVGYSDASPFHECKAEPLASGRIVRFQSHL